MAARLPALANVRPVDFIRRTAKARPVLLIWKSMKREQAILFVQRFRERTPCIADQTEGLVRQIIPWRSIGDAILARKDFKVIRRSVSPRLSVNSLFLPQIRRPLLRKPFHRGQRQRLRV